MPRVYGAIPSKRGVADLQHPRYSSVANAITLPPTYLIADQQPVRDQGQAPMCVGYALTAAMGVGIIRAGIARILSALDAYNGARSLESPPPAEGTSIRDALVYAQHNGVKPEEDTLTTDALLTTVGGWGEVSVATIDLKAALVRTGNNLIIGITVTPGFENPDTNGIVTSGGGDLGYHAVNIVGYSDAVNGGSFRVRNSWSADYGQGGYCWISYSMMRMIIGEAYTATTIARKSLPQLSWWDQIRAAFGWH
jgi:C1A family cysteine protease